MASSAVVSVKAALLALLVARTNLLTVQVTYGWPGDDRVQRERIHFGRSRFDHKPASLRAGRTFRDETGSLDVVITVESVDGTAQAADVRCVALGLEVEQCVADNRNVGNDTGNGITVTAVTMSHGDLVNAYNDRGSLSQLTYTLTWHARLT